MRCARSASASRWTISAPAIRRLSYLRSFPFDKIKIDQSFVRDLGANRDAQAIVRAIISLGTGLGITITAEGVETEAELAACAPKAATKARAFCSAAPAPMPRSSAC